MQYVGNDQILRQNILDNKKTSSAKDAIILLIQQSYD